MKKISTELTRAELEIMKIVWRKGPLFFSELYESFPDGENRPAYTTVSTFVRILVKKGYLGFKVFGKSNQYFSLVGKQEYTKGYMQSVLHNFFDNSPTQLLSFFSDHGKLTPEQYEELKAVAEKILNK